MGEFYRAEKVSTAIKIFLELVRRGQLNADDELELVQAYKNDVEVQTLLTEVLEPLADVQILETLDRLYLSPGPDNRFFGYTNEQLRQRLKLYDNKELYLAYFVIMCLLAMFYGSDSLEEVTRYYVTVEDLEQFVTSKLANLRQTENIKQIEAEVEYNLLTSAELWQDMPEYDTEIKYLRRTTKNRISFILRVCAFLQEEGLVVVQGEREIYLQDKTEQMVRKYYADLGRKEKLLGLIGGSKGVK
ncbi:MAG: hypothetical protein HPY81_04595 [Firmicutes bacterium]|nr:hypothetical protein [Bacillota bacterium]